jgi:hypothetical protein
MLPQKLRSTRRLFEPHRKVRILIPRAGGVHSRPAQEADFYLGERAASLTPKKRSQIAAKAAKARWKKL